MAVLGLDPRIGPAIHVFPTSIRDRRGSIEDIGRVIAVRGKGG
jgi:hypothetical protein